MYYTIYGLYYIIYIHYIYIQYTLYYIRYTKYYLCILHSVYSIFKVHGSDLLFQRWLRHLFNSEKIQSQIYPKQQMCQKMAQPYKCKMGQIAPSTTFLI